MFEAIPYTIMLKTGDEPDAGTTAQVFVRLIGQKPKTDTGYIKLQLAKNKHFTPGSTETFIVQSLDVGELKQIEVKQSKINLSFRDLNGE